MSEPKAIEFRGTIVEMGQPIESSEVGEPSCTVTIMVPVQDARRLAPLLYSPTAFSGRKQD